MPHEPIRYPLLSAAASRLLPWPSAPLRAAYASGPGYRGGAWALADRFALTPLAVAMVLSTIAVALTLTTRGALPVDETRYLTVAWEMWLSGDLLVPHLNGEPYSHKPPMMFWLINGAWALVGPQEWAARAMPALFLPLSVFLTYRLGAELGGRTLGGRAALVFATMTVVVLFGAAMRFEAMLTAATIAGLIGLVHAARRQAALGWLIFASAIGFGVLSKGPVIFIHLLPAALLAPLWLPSPLTHWARWYLGLIAAIAAGSALPLIWAISAAMAGGPEFAASLLWRQTSGRIINSFAHKQPFWFYLPLLPVLIFPWCLSARLWARWHAIPLAMKDGMWRLPVIMIVGSIVALSLVSGKQLQYLLPALPAAALLIARQIGEEEARPIPELAFPLIVAALGLMLILAAYLGRFLPEGLPPSHPAPGILLLVSGAFLYWLRMSTWQVIPTSAALIVAALLWQCHLGALAAFDLGRVAVLLEPSKPVAFVGSYHGQLGFAARLMRPIEAVKIANAATWRATHPDGTLIAPYRGGRPDFGDEPVLDQPYRGKRIGVWAPLGVR